MSESVNGWAMVELLGHRTVFCEVCEVEVAGVKMLRPVNL